MKELCLGTWMSKAQASWISLSWRMRGARWVSQNVRSSSFSTSWTSSSAKSWSRFPVNHIFTTSTCLWLVRELLSRTCEKHMMSQFLASDASTFSSVNNDREVKTAISTLRELQRLVAVLRARLSVLNSSEIYPSNGAECGSSASGEDEFDEGDFKLRLRTNESRYSRKRMCRFSSRCWRPNCWFEHGRDRMERVVNMANYCSEEIESILGPCASDVAIEWNHPATESVHWQDCISESGNCATPARATDHAGSVGVSPKKSVGSRTLLMTGPRRSLISFEMTGLWESSKLRSDVVSWSRRGRKLRTVQD